jgi:hypothetical protein
MKKRGNEMADSSRTTGKRKLLKATLGLVTITAGACGTHGPSLIANLMVPACGYTESYPCPDGGVDAGTEDAGAADGGDAGAGDAGP